jgi:hypothetical protein
VADLRHYLDMGDDIPGPARRMGEQLSVIVATATARPVGVPVTSAVGCQRRPSRRPCTGWMMVRRTSNEIAWCCDACGDDGVIHGWEGTHADLSTLDDNHADDGDSGRETISVLVTRDMFDAMRDVLLLDTAAMLVIARADGRSDGVVLTGAVDTFDEIVDSIAAEANNEPDRRRQRRLDAACGVLEDALRSP